MPAQGLGPQGAGSSPLPAGTQAPNPYRLKPFQPQFPVELEYPPHVAREYERTRRQVLQQLAKNLQGNVRKEAWQIATEFFWRAPEDAVDPLIDVMDRAMGSPALGDVVRNCVEAMGKMANPEFDAALRRALQHKNPAVRQVAYSALSACGTDVTLKALKADFVHMDGRARQAWLGAVAKRLPSADRVAILKSVMMAGHSGPVRDQVLMETVKLPAKEAAEILKGRWSASIEEFKAIIAGVFHAAGDGAGTAWLGEALVSENLEQMRFAIKHCMYGADADAVLGDLREKLLRASTHLRSDIRLETVKQLTRVSGEDVAAVLEVLAAPDEGWEIRAIAVRELAQRGHSEIVTVLLEEVRTATGTRLQSIINQLSVSGDPRAVPELVGRFKLCDEGEGRAFLQAIAQNGSKAAAEALFEIFRGPVRLVSRSSTNSMTTRSYVPLLLLNVRGNESVVVDRFLALPKEEWELRARMLPTIVGYAVDRRDQEDLRNTCIDPVRALLFDRSELPQLRVQALNLLARNWFTVEDVLRLKRSRHKETPQMRALFADFLVNAF
jgi:HEAT repeat protein